MITLVERNKIYQQTSALDLRHAKLNSLVRTTHRELEGSAVTKSTTAEIGLHRPAFHKLWSADHKWYSGSALVVLLD